ncbi:uncharacterized protein LOC117301120 [Asterias rubens]|uniref:uncharacterized protein LOC117301120 n=1 Tax=Asterias rubens TaxID=7604 RepID=UPI00145591CC|nr:uncharacterized protein LOC117301120 [Asterias rubens]
MPTNYNYPAPCGVCLGVFHIIFGLGSCGCGIAAIVLGHYLFEYAVGIWAGIAFYTVTGLLGVCSGSRNNCTVTGYYVMSIISVFVAMGQMSFYCYTTVYVADICYYYGFCPDVAIDSLIVSSIALSLGFFEWIMAMASACASCSCCCGGGPPPPLQTVVVQAVQPQYQQPMPGYSQKPDGLASAPPVYVNPSYDGVFENVSMPNERPLPNTPDMNNY